MSKESTSGGIGFCGMLTILFIGLKLTDHIEWSWLWVLSPLWVMPAAVLSFVAIFVLFSMLIDALPGGKP
jgi:hypothetical protein